MTAFTAGLALARSRLSAKSALVAALVATICAALVAGIERSTDAYGAADRTLTGAVFGLIVPLSAYLALERATLGLRLDRSLDDLARHGANRRALGAGLAAGAALFMAALSALVAALAVWISRGSGDPLLSSDLGSTIWIAALAGVAYAAWFALASLAGKNGLRGAALLVDFVLGSGASALSAPFPRGHVRNLLGGEPVLELGQLSSAAVLLVLVLAYSSASAVRTAP